MTSSAQKESERHIVDLYRQLRGLTGEITAGPEPPDFFLSVDGEQVGIEIVEYHDPKKTADGFTRRGIEAAWEDLRAYVAKFRETRRELDCLSVQLEFKKLLLPRRSEFPTFVESVTTFVAANRPLPETNAVSLDIDGSTDLLLARYLRRVRIRAVRSYMEWDWNFDFGGIGTSDPEMCAVVEPKLHSYRPPIAITSSRLIVAGWNGRMSEIAAPFSAEQLNGFGALNCALANDPFEEVAVLCLRNFVWMRGQGWRSTPLA